MKIYRIRDRETGLFSCGGTTPRFSKRGKVWKQKNHLTCHLSELANGGKEWASKKHVYENCEILEYLVSEVETKVVPVVEELDVIKNKKMEELAQKIARKSKAAQKEEKREWERLKRKYGDE